LPLRLLLASPTAAPFAIMLAGDRRCRKRCHEEHGGRNNECAVVGPHGMPPAVILGKGLAKSTL
jgi:hypothetical protein